MNFSLLADREHQIKTIEAVRSRGVDAIAVESKEAAFAHVQTLIPAKSTVMTGASVTLQQIGFEAQLISGKHPWKNLKDEITDEKDPARQTRLRKEGTMADFFLGSVHAISETGEIVIASATGSQLPAYAFSSENVIWIAGAQKITPSLETALQRVREYVYPLEDKHMKQLYGEKSGSTIGKILIFEREVPFLNRHVHLILVNEILGF
jgi:L-lactate utilization protein LutC